MAWKKEMLFMFKDNRLLKKIITILLILSLFTSSYAFAEQANISEDMDIKVVSKTLEVKLGEYMERSSISNAEVDFLRSDQLTISHNNGIFIEYLVTNGQEVLKGDALASYRIPVDTITIEEKKMNLYHTESGYIESLHQMEESLANSINSLNNLDMDSIEAEIQQINIQKKEMEYEKSKRQLQENLDKLKAEIEELESNLEPKYVYAPYDGIVYMFNEVREETAINRNTQLLFIIDPDSAVLTAPAAATNKMWYNMNVSVALIINRQEDRSKMYKGKIIAADSLLNGLVSSDTYYIQVENGKDILGFGQRANIYAEEIKVKDVIVIPSNVVKSDSDRKYVYILDVDGVVRKQYITGRDNGVDMWVYNGLNEGQHIVIE
ncbi:MAG: efflux RND transporter periplasmic adaptor subunit [Clostridiales bacterium]|nr:efflux RND transporter periplasmic adaptor subunit [Clostridiales bacterium]